MRSRHHPGPEGGGHLGLSFLDGSQSTGYGLAYRDTRLLTIVIQEPGPSAEAGGSSDGLDENIEFGSGSRRSFEIGAIVRVIDIRS